MEYKVVVRATLWKHGGVRGAEDLYFQGSAVPIHDLIIARMKKQSDGRIHSRK